MDPLNPEQLIAFLELLQTTGVEEFEGYGIHVRFAESCFSAGRVVDEGPAPHVELTEPKKIWEEPVLWPGGKPPTFPK